MNTLNQGRYGGEEAPEGLESEQERRRMWREELGIEAPEWKDEGEAPLVDEELLRRYERNELSEEAARRVDALILRFKSWCHAANLIGTEEFRRGNN